MKNRRKPDSESTAGRLSSGRGSLLCPQTRKLQKKKRLIICWRGAHRAVYLRCHLGATRVVAVAGPNPATATARDGPSAAGKNLPQTSRASRTVHESLSSLRKTIVGGADRRSCFRGEHHSAMRRATAAAGTAYIGAARAPRSRAAFIYLLTTKSC